MNERQPVPETYLGDGLYASYDGWQIKLRAPQIVGDQEVYLEPAVLRAFEHFIVDVVRRMP
jgi:hypothetical protein